MAKNAYRNAFLRKHAENELSGLDADRLKEIIDVMARSGGHAAGAGAMGMPGGLYDVLPGVEVANPYSDVSDLFSDEDSPKGLMSYLNAIRDWGGRQWDALSEWGGRQLDWAKENYLPLSLGGGAALASLIGLYLLHRYLKKRKKNK